MRAVRRALIVLAAAGALGAVVARSWPARTTSPEFFVPSSADLGDYVGAAQCAQCHREICDRQCESRMARALTTADDYRRQHDLRLPAVVDDPGNALRYRVEARQGGLFLEVSRGDEVAGARMDYALGSGERGLSFVRDEGPDSYQELRVSYFADTRSWDLTPGQESDQPTSVQEALGRRVAKRSEMACLNCHSSRLVQANGKIDQAASHFGIDCERCHGPGREHVAAAGHGERASVQSSALAHAVGLAEQLRAGRRPESPQDEMLLSVARANDDRLIRDLYVCGECHGRRQIWSPPGDEQLARFQVAGLVASKCYQASAGKLRCTDCHDPHRDIEAGDRALVVAVCLACHAPDDRDAAQPPDAAVDRVRRPSCPVNPTSECIDCHMPTRSPMYRTRFTHHRIGVHPESASAVSAPP